MALDLLPTKVRAKYRIDEREHAIAILKGDFPEQYQDILDVLDAFWLKRSYIMEPGGGRSPVSYVIDGFLSGIIPTRATGTSNAKHKHTEIAPIGPIEGLGWAEKKFDIKIEVDGSPIPIPTHKIDNFKQLEGQPRGVGLEVEWNNKDPFYGVCSIIAGSLGGLSFAGSVQGVGGSVALLGSLLTLHVQGNSGGDVRLGANRID